MDDPLPSTCRNCGAPLGSVYCGECGQSHRYGRLRFRGVIEDSFEGVASFDSRILRTLVGMTVRPAVMISDYLRGRRIAYMHPLKYALVTCALWLFVVHLVLSATPIEGLDEVHATAAVLQRRYMQPLHFAAMPLMVAALALRFRRVKLTFLEHYVAVLYAYGHVFLVSTVVMGLAVAFQVPLQDDTHFAILAVYMGLALGSFYGGVLAWTGLQVAAIWMAVTLVLRGVLIFGIWLWL